jgi:hypothetical protein
MLKYENEHFSKVNFADILSDWLTSIYRPNKITNRLMVTRHNDQLLAFNWSLYWLTKRQNTTVKKQFNSESLVYLFANLNKDSSKFTVLKS